MSPEKSFDSETHDPHFSRSKFHRAAEQTWKERSRCRKSCLKSPISLRDIRSQKGVQPHAARPLTAPISQPHSPRSSSAEIDQSQHHGSALSGTRSVGITDSPHAHLATNSVTGTIRTSRSIGLINSPCMLHFSLSSTQTTVIRRILVQTNNHEVFQCIRCLQRLAPGRIGSDNMYCR